MIIPLWYLLKSLTHRQIIASVSMPVLSYLVFSHLREWVSDLCGQLCLMVGPFFLDLILLFLLIFLVGLPLTAWVRNEDRFSVKAYVDSKIAPVSDKVKFLEKEFQQKTTWHDHRIVILEDWARNVVEELRKSGIEIPPPDVPVHNIPFHLGSPTVSVSGITLTPSNRLARLRLWLVGQARRFWEYAYRCVWNWNSG